MEAVYIMTNDAHSILYIGVTKNFLTRINKRIYKENLEDVIARVNVTKLVYYKSGMDVGEVVKEKNRIINLSWEKKVELIESVNQDWYNVYENIGFFE